jgi:hypothetical protein
VRCLVDEKGERLFTNGEITLLASKNAKVVNRLWEAAIKHNDLAEEKIEELAKN